MTWICEYGELAPWILLGLLLLAGLNIPISEDIILITGGALASTCLPEKAIKIYFILFLGSYISAWEVYWIGRILGPNIYKIKFFKYIVSPKKIHKLERLYDRFGIFTFIVGRFVPGGIRNALFMTCGLGKMPFLKFIARDIVGCLLSTSIIFFVGYKFGENYDTIVYFFKKYELIAFIIVLTLGILLMLYFLKLRHHSVREKNESNKK